MRTDRRLTGRTARRDRPGGGCLRAAASPLVGSLTRLVGLPQSEPGDERAAGARRTTLQLLATGSRAGRTSRTGRLGWIPMSADEFDIRDAVREAIARG